MIGKVVKIGNIVISVITVFIAICLIMYGFLTLMDMFRTEIKAFASNDLLKFRPDVEKSEPPYLDDLILMNPDTAGWITLYGTHINYPVMQGETDLEYINKDVYGEYSISGSIFLSVLNKRDFSEPYQLIYGHHMDNGSMFGDIDRFLDKDFFYNTKNKRAKDNEGLLILQDKIYDLTVLAMLKTDAYDEMIYEADKSRKDMGDVIDYLKKEALYFKDAGKVKHMIALSTCDSSSSSGRLVLLLKADLDKKPLPLHDMEKHKVKRKAIGHQISVKHWAFLNLIALIITMYLMFPLHLIGKLRFMDNKGSTIVSLILGALTLGIFILTEDVRRPMDMADGYTPLMIACLGSLWIVQKNREMRSDPHFMPKRHCGG